MEKSNVVISGICPRRDRFNQLLAGKCGENNFDCIPHNNIDTRLHLNRDGLHINRKGTFKLVAILKIILIMAKIWSKSAKLQSH